MREKAVHLPLRLELGSERLGIDLDLLADESTIDDGLGSVWLSLILLLSFHSVFCFFDAFNLIPI